MNLILENWTNKDFEKLQAYLKTFSKKERIAWSENLNKSRLPSLAAPAPQIKKIASQIIKGNWQSFLKVSCQKYFENALLEGFIIASIKDFDLFEKKFLAFTKTIDNWAVCDMTSSKIKVTNKNKDTLFSLAKKLALSSGEFTVRCGLVLFFKFIDETHIDEILNFAKKFKSETKYYVNMALAWLLCECVIKQKEKTISFLESKNISDFVFLKTISKCFDSFRVDEKTKMFLKSLKNG